MVYTHKVIYSLFLRYLRQQQSSLTTMPTISKKLFLELVKKLNETEVDEEYFIAKVILAISEDITDIPASYGITFEEIKKVAKYYANRSENGYEEFKGFL